ncbi:MAG TPA: hypothetical protein VHR17_14445, partial [Thermoanaerobaculia bacterium]|nr:hypothetical protein [Thermoanaerobaculia bacterium]
MRLPGFNHHSGLVLGIVSSVLGFMMCAGASAAEDSAATSLVEWSHYAGDRASSKYSPAAQIDASNVGRLEIAWRWTTPDRGIDTKAP